AALIKKGFILEGKGRNREAVPVLLAGLRWIDQEEQPHLLLQGKHNLISSLAQSGSPRKAWRLLADNRSLYHEVGFPADRVRLHWLEGKIAGLLDRFKEAEMALSEVREFFLDREDGVNVFYVSLDLAEIYTRDRRCRRAKEVLGEVIPLGEALGIQKLTLIARLLYEQASRA
ncbi:MAG TPA: hypothetical protein VG477_19065, partial [Thermoanaerobaculia bacterium]|nr:hypothetical protein [Thermoanaerobaculia bacterium]